MRRFLTRRGAGGLSRLAVECELRPAGRAYATAPPVPGGLVLTVLGTTSVGVAWSASAGATSYVVERNGAQVGTPSGTTYTDTGLTSNTAYTYAIRAVAVGGTSAASGTAAATTDPEAADLTALQHDYDAAHVTLGADPGLVEIAAFLDQAGNGDTSEATASLHPMLVASDGGTPSSDWSDGIDADFTGGVTTNPNRMSCPNLAIKSALIVAKHRQGWYDQSSRQSLFGTTGATEVAGIPGVRLFDVGFVSAGQASALFGNYVWYRGRKILAKYVSKPVVLEVIGVDIPAGVTVARVGGASNGDPRTYGWWGRIKRWAFHNATISDADWARYQHGQAAKYNTLQYLTRRQIVFFGHSIIEGPLTNGDRDCASRVLELSAGAWDVVNGGKFGESSTGGAARFSSEMLALADERRTTARGNTLVVMEVTNDLTGGVPNATIIVNHVDIATAARAAGYNWLVLCTCINDGNGSRGAGFDTNQALINTYFRANFAAMGYDALADAQAKTELQTTTDTTYFNDDQVHLTGAGQVKLGDVIFAVC